MMFRNAILKLTTIFGLNSIESVVIYYHPGGPKQMEGFMKNGKKEGYWIYWNLEGTVIKREWYKNGAVVY